jgi:hypothetical protein
MTPTPSLILKDDYVDDVGCAICGQPALQVVHVETFPDYVTCSNCGSAFVVEEGGERVMYGKIDNAYPETQHVALRQWIWPETVEKQAASEHPPTAPIDTPTAPFLDEPVPLEPSPYEAVVPPAAVPIPTEPEISPSPEPPVLEPEVEPDPHEAPLITPQRFEEALDMEIDTPVLPASPEVQVPPTAAIETLVGEEEVSKEPRFTFRENDPPTGQRFRVVIKGTKVKFPGDVCAHCSGTPVRGRLALIGSLPKGQGVGQRQSSAFNLPLCAQCHKRAAQRSEEEKGARLQAHLVSALIALVLLVVALALGINPIEEGLMGVMILVILAAVGYTAPAMLLLSRIGPYPVSEDAAYVRSTLIVPGEVQSLETAFEWRNQAYAERFHQSNEEYSLGNVVKVKDRNSLPDPQA